MGARGYLCLGTYCFALLEEDLIVYNIYQHTVLIHLLCLQ